MKKPIIVLKFGSSVLRSAADLPRAVHEIFRYTRDGFGVIAVVSAFDGVTDRLLAQAKVLGAEPEHDAGISGLAALVASGERETAASLQIALSRAGLPANVLDPLAAGLRVVGNGLEGSPVDLAAGRLVSLLDRGLILVVPGFFGTDEEGGVSLLGRGGSDWTALFLAQRLGAICRLLKDTDGIYERDPNGEGEPPQRFERLHFEDALALHAPVVQEGALRFALAHGQTFEVAQIGSVGGTSVDGQATLLAKRVGPALRPLRVTLLGLGAVGRGVYEHLRREKGRFELVAIAVRDVDRHAESGVPRCLLFPLEVALAVPSDIVVEAIGGVAEAGEALVQALADGRHVVTANKAVVVARGEQLRALAEREGARFSFSAAVGGVIPVIERLRGLRSAVARVEGVLNGTSNFVLGRLAAGVSLEEAVSEARHLGYAEADPTDDLSGLDVARKLALIAHEAFGVTLDLERIPRLEAAALAAARPDDRGGSVKLIGSVEATEKGCEARVELTRVAPSHPFARCRGASNAVIITMRSGLVLTFHGRGAGRWPTAESVMGDLLELWRDRDAQQHRPTTILGRFEAVAS